MKLSAARNSGQLFKRVNWKNGRWLFVNTEGYPVNFFTFERARLLPEDMTASDWVLRPIPKTDSEAKILPDRFTKYANPYNAPNLKLLNY